MVARRILLLFISALAVSPLAAQEKPQEKIITGQVRLRSELDNRDILAQQTTLYHLMRSRIRATVRPVAGITVLGEVQDSRYWGQADASQARGTTDANAEGFDMHQAW